MRLSDWARKQNISYRTAWRWVKENRMPVPFTQTETGMILVHEPESRGKNTALYARVSSHDQKADLDRQLARLVVYATGQKLTVVKTVTEVGSAMNGKRSKLLQMLADPDIDIIVIEHRDRLIRFGFDYLEAALQASKRQLIVIEDTEIEDDLVRDMTEVLTSLCARLYGKRGAANRAKAAMSAAKKESD